MTQPADLIFEMFKDIGITPTTIKHEPCFTVAESEEIDKQIDAVPTRNLFVKDKANKYWLITLEAQQPVCLKKLRYALGAKQRLSFGKPEILKEMLGVTPGSVTPLGLIFQKGKADLVFVIDKNLMKADKFAVHPLQNDMSSILTPQDFEKILKYLAVDKLEMDFSLYEPDDLA